MPEFVETDAGSIAYSVHGEGSPLVLLPGFQSNRVGWRAPNDYLAHLDGFQVINVDPLGHGKSTMSHDDAHYSVPEVVSHVLAVLDELDIDRAQLWGFSRGGVLAALCADQAPQRCRSAVLGAAPIGAAWESTMQQLQKAEPFLAAGDWAGYWELWPGPLPEEMRTLFEQTNDAAALAAALRGMFVWSAGQTSAVSDTCEVPRFAYFGSGEVWADEQRQALAATDITVHEGDWPGHAETMFDAQGVADQVVPFLREHR